MTELEQLKTKIHQMEEAWCSFIENYNRDFSPQSKLLIADMTKRMETYCFPRDKEVDTVYCSWQTFGDFKMLAAVSIRKEYCHYDSRFWAEVMKEARRGNHTMVEWCESRYEFEEWLRTPSAAIQLEEGLKRLYCNFFKDILNY